jgi:hypothetical protein
MTVSKPAADSAKGARAARKEPTEAVSESAALQMGELSELLGYSLKRAQLKVFEDFLRCVAPLQLTPAKLPIPSESCGRISWRCSMAWKAAICVRGCVRPTIVAPTSWS